MNNIQAMINGMNLELQRERSETQMTLGEMIQFLEGEDPEMMIHGIGTLDSYRGYYEDLAFSPALGSATVQNLLDTCRGAMGKTFTGYKGGDYLMGESTPLWFAEYGCTGTRIMDILPSGTIETLEEE